MPFGKLVTEGQHGVSTGWVPYAFYFGMELLAQCVKQPKTLKGIGLSVFTALPLARCVSLLASLRMRRSLLYGRGDLCQAVPREPQFFTRSLPGRSAWRLWSFRTRQKDHAKGDNLSFGIETTFKKGFALHLVFLELEFGSRAGRARLRRRFLQSACPVVF